MPTKKTKVTMANFVPSGVAQREDKVARDKIIRGGKKKKKKGAKLGAMDSIRSGVKKKKNRLSSIMNEIRSSR